MITAPTEDLKRSFYQDGEEFTVSLSDDKASLIVTDRQNKTATVLVMEGGTNTGGAYFLVSHKGGCRGGGQTVKGALDAAVELMLEGRRLKTQEEALQEIYDYLTFGQNQ